MTGRRGRFGTKRVAGLLLVLALHAAALWGLWNHRLIPTPREAVTLFVSFIAPPPPPKAEESPKPKPPPKPRPVEKPRPRQLVAEAPVVSPAEPIAPPPPPEPAPVIEAPSAPPPPKPAGPITLGSELSVACPERTPPRYPSLSRRRGEEGMVVLRVELDEQGHVSSARVAAGSGHVRLDEAALAAVRIWRCQPARRDGQPVKAVALQPFKFIIEGR